MGRFRSEAEKEPFLRTYGTLCANFYIIAFQKVIFSRQNYLNLSYLFPIIQAGLIILNPDPAIVKIS